MWQNENKPRGRKTGIGHLNNGEEGPKTGATWPAGLERTVQPEGDCSQDRASGERKEGLGIICWVWVKSLLGI